MKTRLRTAAARLGLTVGSILLLILLLEATLQAGAWYMRATEQQLPTTWATSHLRILCLGDSNTYGVWLEDRARAYPAQLERLWNEALESPQVEVLNLGYPGLNSSRLLIHLPELLDALRPDHVIVMVGNNDFWTAPVEIDNSRKVNVRRFLIRHSRVYQLFYMTWAQIFGHPEVEVNVVRHRDRGAAEGTVRVGDRDFSFGFEAQAGNPRKILSELMNNLVSIVGEVDESGAKPILMTYPSDKKGEPYRPANRIIRAAADETGAQLIDLANVFAGICPTVRCPDLLLPDQHPNAKGYALVAETIFQRLSSTSTP